MAKARNFDATLIKVTAGASDAEFSVSHQLGKKPTDAFCVLSGGSGILYKSTTAWTASLAYLKSTTANQDYYVWFFV